MERSNVGNGGNVAAADGNVNGPPMPERGESTKSLMLLVDFAAERQATAVVRGLRAVSDFEFEFQLALMNRKLNERVETIFMMPKESYTFISSRMIKEVARLGGDVSSFVPPHVESALKEKYDNPRHRTVIT